MRNQDSNMGHDALGARVLRYWPLVGPSFSTPCSKRRPGAAIEPVDGPAFELLGLNGL
jgi:hypothetical protein